MIDIANLYLDDSRPKQVAEFPSVNSAMYKLSLDAGHYYNKIDQERNSTPTRLKDFVFPRPPQVQSIRPVSTSSACNGTSDSDTQSDSDCRCRPRTRPKRSSPIAIHTSCNANHQESLTSSSPMTFQSLPSFLPPIGVFWDIENCNVPKGCSAVLVAQVIRDSFFDGYREAEFLVVCDVTKEPSKVIQELNDAQVNLIHVPSLHKNAADEKLRQSMRRFADIHGSPAAVVLITGDINFISDVSDLRHRRKIHVILLHQDNTSESLILCANESHNILRLFEALPPRESKTSIEPYQLTVHNLPSPVEPARIRSRLKRISDNCGGRVVEVMTGAATINFSTRDLAQRAQKRMSGADVFGNKITVGPPRRCAATPTKNGAGGGATVAPPPQQVVTATHFTATSSVYTQFTPAAGGSWSDKRQMANSQNGGSADYSWNQPQPAGASVKKVRENTPERFRPIRKQHQDDASLMPPPIPASNLKTYTSSAKNQVPAVKPEPGVSPYSVTACSTSPYSLTSDDDERFFHPIPAQAKVEFVELQVTNLDQSMETKDMKTMLMKVFSEHVMVLHVTVYIQSDGNVAARVRVPSPADARFAISQLHRRKVGSRRILISYVTVGGPSPQVLKAQIWSLLVDVPGHRLPLFKFCELYESRFIISVGVSDLYKLRDVCVLTEERGGRMISLNPDYRGTLSPLANAAQDALELPFCSLHMDRPGGSDKGWAEQEADVLPTVRIGLQALASRVGQLLLSHKGYLPLPSLPRCYEALFGPLTGDKGGVPLEHLLGCLPGVEIHQGPGCVKYLRWAPAGEADDHQAKCASPPLAQQLDFFSRELVELLKTLPRCLLLFNRFIPAYHHHFGRQCRVADYGYTKLVDLLEALPHTVQVLGEGSKRLVTLSHRAQVRRFTSDLLRLLKAQPSKQVALSEFAAVFLRVIGKEWDVADYGVCDIVDMLNAVSRALVVVTPMENDVNIAILKREQTPTEVSRTKIFADEVIELLRHAPQCSMLFSKFIPAYHHHFGHQCRVADYGFAKLRDLFEAIPLVAKMDDGAEGEPRVSLTLTESVRVLASQISTVVGAAPASTLLLSRLPAAFTAMFGYALRPEAYGCTSILQLVQSLGDSITVVDSGYGGPMARLRPPSVLYNAQGMKVWRVLVETGAVLCLTATQFFNAYWQCHQEVFSLDSLADFPDIVQVSFAGGELIVQLTATMSFAGDVFHLLLATPGGRLPLARLPAEYGRQFGRSLEPSQFGHASLGSLLAAIGQVAVVLDGETVTVNERLAEVGFKLPGAGSAAPDSSNAFLKGLLGGYKPAFKVDVAKPDTPAKVRPAGWLASYQWRHLSPLQYKPNGCTSVLDNNNLCIPIELGQPKVPDHMSSKLYSPAAGLMCAYKNPAAAGRMPLNIVSPAASQLPMPTSFASRSTESDCEEALVNGSDSHGDNSLDMNSSGNSTPTRVRRKKRLAAHFSTPIET